MKQLNTKWVLGHKVTSYEPTGDYDLMVGETPAGVQGPPPHLHYNYNESFMILEGEMEFFLNGVTKIAVAGDFIDLPPNTLHTFANVSDSPCKWVNIHSPKGFAQFFENIGVPAHEENARERSVTVDIIQEVIDTAANYDMLLKLS